MDSASLRSDGGQNFRRSILKDRLEENTLEKTVSVMNILDDAAEKVIGRLLNQNDVKLELARGQLIKRNGTELEKITNDFEKRLIESTLEATDGVQKRAADLLHVKPTTLNEMIKRHDINSRRKQKAHSDRRNKSASINPESVFSSDKFSQQ